MGPAYCRKRVQDSARVTSASFQQGIFLSGGPWAGSGNGTRSRYSLEEGGNRGGPSSQQRVRVLQLLLPLLHHSEEGWVVASNSMSETNEPLSHEIQVQDAYYQASRVTNQVRGDPCSGGSGPQGFRDAGSFSSVETLSPRAERPSCASTHRQYVDGVLHQHPESEFWNWIKVLIFKCL